MVDSRGTAGGRSERRDVVEALTETSDHLDFALAMVRRTVGDQERLAQLTARIREIEVRLRDDRYYLAVIGEFSAGKSTFINALLAEDLLPTSALPTTGAATRITHGDEFAVEVRFSGDGIRYVYPSGRYTGAASPLGRMLGHLAPDVPVPEDTAGVLRLLTAHEAIAPHVLSLEVRHPAAALRDGLVIIDTPGTNARAGHTDITRAVMRDIADVAAVLTASTSPSPVSLTEFLTDALDPGQIRRCIILVTKMDHIDETEREDLLAHVRQRFARMLGVTDPVVEPVAAEPVVRLATGRPLRGPEQAHWAEEFPRTLARLRDLMQRQRIVAVSDHLLRLLEDLLDELGREVTLAQHRLDAEEAELNGARIADMAGFVRAQHGETARLLGAGAQRAEQAVGGMAPQWWRYTRAEIDRELDGASTPDELRAVIGTRAPELIRQGLPRIGDIVQQAVTSALSAATDTAKSAVDAAFEAAYEKLGGVAELPRQDRLTVLTGHQLADAAMQTYENSVTGVTQQIRAVRLEPGAAKTPGARIGGALDQWFGNGRNGETGPHSGRAGFGGFMAKVADSLASTDMTALRNHARGEMHQTLRTVADGLSQQIDEAVRTATTHYSLDVSQHVDRYRATYEATVAELVAEHHRREDILAARRSLLHDADRQTERRRATVNSQRERLTRRGEFGT
ncbi:dynamin family protein [Embleya sp. NBC_00896]|uniref:dynamin family protein n=1 Tax=Embleya sp. NBC_00896 TaxID=2975961 RepID=UPI003863C780|nr:dynamin family protein [Embleya sp. NBC_00896]